MYGVVTDLLVAQNSLSNINITRIRLTPWNSDTPVWFATDNVGGGILPKDEPIVVTGPVAIVKVTGVKQGSTLSSYTYPAIGYWTDYSLETVIRPSENAHCYAEQEMSDPEPEPDPEPTPDPDPEPEPDGNDDFIG